jgi:hypothetical protein
VLFSDISTEPANGYGFHNTDYVPTFTGIVVTSWKESC